MKHTSFFLVAGAVWVSWHLFHTVLPEKIQTAKELRRRMPTLQMVSYDREHSLTFFRALALGCLLILSALLILLVYLLC